jgi:NAD-dependent SIR2 family protein deacetylase
MSFQHFLGSHQARQRYWAGSHIGWRRFSAARPNAGHQALADLEDAGVVNGIVTQNVDGLHLQAGSRRVVDLHGSLDRVRCLACGQLFDRGSIAARLTHDNPWLEDEDLPLNPDGDVTVEYTGAMVVPECSVCGGMLKPEVVFFGEFVPLEKFTAARAIVESSQALVVAGSSLVVNSGLRLVEVATRRRLPVIIVNRGQTKGDRRASARIEAGTTEVLRALCQALVG